MVKRLLLLCVLALLVGAGSRFATLRTRTYAASPVLNRTDTVDQPPPTAAPGSHHPRWIPVWTRPTPDLRDLSLAPDGATVAWVDTRGAVRRIGTASGTTLWQSTGMPGVDGVLAVAGGDVLAFSRLNPLDTTIHLFDVAGATAAGAPRVSTFPITGAIWSVAASPQGDRAYVGTGHSDIQIVSLNPAGVIATNTPGRASGSSTSIATQGIPESIVTSTATGAGVAAIVAGTWQDAGIDAWSSSGAPLWPPHDDPRPDRSYDASVSADGSTVVAISTRKPRGLEPRIQVWDGRTGKFIWSQMILDSDDAHALISAHGDVIAMSYAEIGAETTPAAAPTRKLALFNRQGNRLFADKGGRYFAPTLVALAADGSEVTVRDDTGSLRVLDSAGRILSHTPLTPDPKTGRIPTVRATFVSADGHFLLLQRGDAQITLFKYVNS